MKIIFKIFFVVASCLFTNSVSAQVSLETFFAEIKHFVAADYSKRTLKTIKNWSYSHHTLGNSKKRIKLIWYEGKLKTIEGAKIDFGFFASELVKINDKKCSGTILISYDGSCNAALLKSVLSYIPKYRMSFDTIRTISGATCSCIEIRLHFNNYSPSTNKVLESIDTSLIRLLKDEYLDFYYADINKKTSKWQTDFRTLMQPYSDALITLIERKNIRGIFELLALKNVGYSWFLAEGLWYYNSLHPCLTADQLKIIDAYNGKKSIIPFRSAEELKKVYNF